MSEILAPAIQLAEEGFPVDEYPAYKWKEGKTSYGRLDKILQGKDPHSGSMEDPFHTRSVYLKLFIKSWGRSMKKVKDEQF